MVFQHLRVVAFRRSPDLRDLLVTVKLSSSSANPQLPSGSFWVPSVVAKSALLVPTILTDSLHKPSFPPVKRAS